MSPKSLGMNYENPYFSETTSDFMPLFTAGPKLWRLFMDNGFRPQVGFNSHTFTTHQFEQGKMQHLRKNGECIVVFLKDRRVHVMNGPLSRWQLFDHLNMATLRCILAFASMNENDQYAFRNYMKERCTSYRDLFHHLPVNNVGWKNRFLHHYSSFPAMEILNYAQ